MVPYHYWPETVMGVTSAQITADVNVRSDTSKDTFFHVTIGLQRSFREGYRFADSNLSKTSIHQQHR